jgi:hypothetical protein
VEAQKQKMSDLARELWEGYLKEARGRPREALIRLKQAAVVLQVSHFYLPISYSFHCVARFRKSAKR